MTCGCRCPWSWLLLLLPPLLLSSPTSDPCKAEPQSEPVKNDESTFWFDGQHWWPYQDQWGVYGLEDAGMVPQEEQLVSMTAKQRSQRRELMVAKLSKTHDRVKVCPDSGAVGFVAPPSFAKTFKIKSTELSRNGHHFRAANGGVLPNMGCRDVKALGIMQTPMYQSGR